MVDTLAEDSKATLWEGQIAQDLLHLSGGYNFFNLNSGFRIWTLALVGLGGGCPLNIEDDSVAFEDASTTSRSTGGPLHAKVTFEN